MPDNLLPWLSGVLQSRYLDSRRAYIASRSELTQWPRRRTSKRKPLPGLLEPLEQEG